MYRQFTEQPIYRFPAWLTAECFVFNKPMGLNSNIKGPARYLDVRGPHRRKREHHLLLRDAESSGDICDFVSAASHSAGCDTLIR